MGMPGACSSSSSAAPPLLSMCSGARNTTCRNNHCASRDAFSRNHSRCSCGNLGSFGPQYAEMRKQVSLLVHSTLAAARTCASGTDRHSTAHEGTISQQQPPANFSLTDLSALTDGMPAGQVPERHRAVAHSCWPALTAAMAADTDLGAAASTSGSSREAVLISAGMLPTMRQQVCTSADLQPKMQCQLPALIQLAATKAPASFTLRRST